ncbi:putative fatty acid elongation protein 3 [Centruroides sculpturatus]|uniref:putative fatty acid elongation protein 3 n=1 Tax=Centruroides sculpturatus TaxID=218467 RepID=UPI000C6C990E|nr:putative fatty acid elongation protein 3 [Centruroides sculpturatus]
MKAINLSEPLPAPFQFETIIDKEDVKRFYRNYWHYSVYIATIYLITIYFLREYMKTRPAFELKRASIVWNGILALFSIIATVRVFSIILFAFSHYTFYHIVCDKMLTEQSPQFIFWGTLFLFSKVWELGDTVLIVLRKRNLMFLHWYHHVATLIGMWHGVYREASFGTLISYTNVFVHSFMYSYFALKSIEVKIPVKFAMFITAIQTLQMLFGVLLSFWVYWLHVNNYECDTPKDVLETVFVIYLSYLFLFSYLFYNSYIKSRSKKKRD